MKVVALLLVGLCINHITDATWKIGKIINQSDLDLVSASYIKPQKKTIGYLTRKIKQAEKENMSTVDLMYRVGETSKGCSLIDLSGGYYISVDGHPSHTIMWARAKTHENKKYIGKEVLDAHKHQYGARVFFEKEGAKAPLVYSVQGYNQEGTVFDILLSGHSGNYQITLNRA